MISKRTGISLLAYLALLLSVKANLEKNERYF